VDRCCEMVMDGGVWAESRREVSKSRLLSEPLSRDAGQINTGLATFDVG
jgi:hypothetical protein